jgi:baculoviral IAP repeat-containing protein 6
MQSTPIHYNASIFIRTDPNNLCAVRVLITGPEDTPYEKGCFIFDTYVEPSYPNGPPKMQFLNTGGERFNPNLYNSGKVCLSILGTWNGAESEKWIPQASTLYQVFISIQGQIMVEQPYYNEPGYESNSSKSISDAYNMNIRLYTMKHSMLNLLTEPNKYPQFTEVIKKHFFLQKDKVKSLCKKWVDNADDKLRDDYQNTYAKLIVELDKLNFDL